MKTTSVLLLLSLFVMLFSRCDSHGNDAPPYSYHLKLKFEDSSGKNLVNGLTYQEGNIDYPYQVTGSYKLQVSSTHVSDEKKLLHVEVEDNQAEYLYLTYSTFDNVSPVVTWKLVCPHIFGDNEEHIISSYWKEERHAASCSKITCDDKDFQLTREQGAVAYTAVIILAR